MSEHGTYTVVDLKGELYKERQEWNPGSWDQCWEMIERDIVLGNKTLMPYRPTGTNVECESYEAARRFHFAVIRSWREEGEIGDFWTEVRHRTYELKRKVEVSVEVKDE